MYSTMFVWTLISGYEPMEECHTSDRRKVGWINPDSLTKLTPRNKWGTHADWPGEWEGVPHVNDADGQPLDWELSRVCESYEAAKSHVVVKWSNEKADRCRPDAGVEQRKGHND